MVYVASVRCDFNFKLNKVSAHAAYHTKLLETPLCYLGPIGMSSKGCCDYIILSAS